MQSFIKIRGTVLEENADKILTLCNFDKDVFLLNLFTRLVLTIYNM